MTLLLMTIVMALAPTKAEIAWAKYDWHNNVTYTRHYDAKGRKYREVYSKVLTPAKWYGQVEVNVLHPEGTYYETCLYVITRNDYDPDADFGPLERTTIVRVFVFNHAVPWDGVEAEIRR